jgi:hypothetical protein
MSPSDIEEHISREPFIPLRLTLASGDIVDLDDGKRILMTGYALYYLISDNPESRIGKKVRLISIPNIVMIEPKEFRPGRDGRRRR